MRARGTGGGTLRESPEFSFTGCERKGQWDRLSCLRPADGLPCHKSRRLRRGLILWDAAGRNMSTHSRVIGAHAHAHECTHTAAPQSRAVWSSCPYSLLSGIGLASGRGRSARSGHLPRAATGVALAGGDSARASAWAGLQGGPAEPESERVRGTAGLAPSLTCPLLLPFSLPSPVSGPVLEPVELARKL